MSVIQMAQDELGNVSSQLSSLEKSVLMRTRSYRNRMKSLEQSVSVVKTALEDMRLERVLRRFDLKVTKDENEALLKELKQLRYENKYLEQILDEEFGDDW